MDSSLWISCSESVFRTGGKPGSNTLRQGARFDICISLKAGGWTMTGRILNLNEWDLCAPGHVLPTCSDCYLIDHMHPILIGYSRCSYRYHRPENNPNNCTVSGFVTCQRRMITIHLQRSFTRHLVPYTTISRFLLHPVSISMARPIFTSWTAASTAAGTLYICLSRFLH